MIAVLVRHQNRIDRLRLLADSFEAFEDLFAADAGIDKDASVAVPDEYRVPGAAARENTDSEDSGSWLKSKSRLYHDAREWHKMFWATAVLSCHGVHGVAIPFPRYPGI